MRLHHVGILVNDLDKATCVFNSLGGTEQGDIMPDEYRKIQIKWVKMEPGGSAGAYKI